MSESRFPNDPSHDCPSIPDGDACQRVRGMLNDLMDDALPIDDVSAVESHLAACPACADAFQRLVAVEADLAALGRAAERLAAAPRPVVPPLRHWRTAAMRVAAALLFATLVGYGVYTWQVRDANRRLIVDAGTDAYVEPPSAGGTQHIQREPRPAFSIETPEGVTAVQLQSSRPDIHIVWLYETPDAAAPQESPQEPPAPDDSSMSHPTEGDALCSAQW